MIYRTIRKISNIKYQISNSEQGVTLLLAILLLSSILSISFSLATVLFIEVRNSSDLIRTDSSYYGADGVAEQSLFNVRRHVISPGYITQFSNNSNINGTPTVTSTTTPTFQGVVAANSTFSNTASQYNFCDVTAGTGGCGYNKLVLTYLPTGNADALDVYLCEFDPNATSYTTTPCSTQSDSSSGYWISSQSVQTPTTDGVNGVYMSQGGTSSLTWNLHSGLQQELILFTSSTNPIYFSIQTYDASGNPKGLPLAGKSSVNINVTNGTTGRKLQVIIPNQ